MNPEGRTLDTRSIERLLDNASGIAHVRYDVCDRNCVCYTAYPDLQACPACHLPRHRPNGKPWRTFDYIPIIHRIRLQMADRRLAKKIWKYPNRLMETRTENPDLIRDIWYGKLCDHLQCTGLFDIRRSDLGLLFPSDVVKLFNRGYF